MKSGTLQTALSGGLGSKPPEAETFCTFWHPMEWQHLPHFCVLSFIPKSNLVHYSLKIWHLVYDIWWQLSTQATSLQCGRGLSKPTAAASEKVEAVAIWYSLILLEPKFGTVCDTFCTLRWFTINAFPPEKLWFIAKKWDGSSIFEPSHL